jgi:hypothetical protein
MWAWPGTLGLFTYIFFIIIIKFSCRIHIAITVKQPMSFSITKKKKKHVFRDRIVFSYILLHSVIISCP